MMRRGNMTEWLCWLMLVVLMVIGVRLQILDRRIERYAELRSQTFVPRDTWLVEMIRGGDSLLITYKEGYFLTIQPEPNSRDEANP